MWNKEFKKTERGKFEYFTAGQGEPIAILH